MTIQERYNKQIKEDRKAAALERRQNDYRPALQALYNK